jgi:phage head maturation protease
VAVITDQPEGALAFDKIFSFPIEKSKTEITADGDMFVYGKCTDGRIDADEQIVDPEWSADALSKWFETGANVRQQHDPKKPVGKGMHIELNRDADGGHWLRAEVVDRDAQRLVKKGVLQAFSVGIMKPKIFAHNKARGGIIKGGEMGEVSLVDRPANSGCGYAIVKATGNGTPEYIGKLSGDAGVLRKALGIDPRDMLKMPQPEKGVVPGIIRSSVFADPVSNRLNDALQDEDLLMKRDFSASARRRSASSGHAMSDGSFPIENGGDLDNAIHLAGHGKNPAAARSHIRRQASRLGLSDKIPDTWKMAGDAEDISDLTSGLTEELVKAINEGLASVDEVREELGKTAEPDLVKCATCDGSGTIRGGAVACPDCKGKPGKGDEDGVGKSLAPPDDGDDDDDDDDDKDTGGSDSDTGNNTSGKSARTGSGGGLALGKKPRNRGNGAGAKPSADVQDNSMSDDSASGPKGRNYSGNKTSKKFACSSCGHKALKSAAFCAGCGAEFVGKRGDPAAGVVAKKPTKPLPSHREPDGNVQDLEGDAGLPSSRESDGRDNQLNAMGWDSSGKPPAGAALLDGGSSAVGVGSGNSTSMGRKGFPAPYSVARMHDATCSAYSLQVVLDEYPSLAKVADAMDVEDIRMQASKALADGDYDLSELMLGVARNADIVIKTDADIVEDVHADMHKGFQSMYPTAKPTPGSVSPGMFKRPYVDAGHAPLSAEPRKADPAVPMPPEAPNAQDFTRGALTAGEQRESPGKQTDTARAKPGRRFYSNMAKTDARTAMQAVHDHVSSMFPDLCPLNAQTALPSPMAKAEGSEQPQNLNLQAGEMTPEDVTKAVQEALLAAGYDPQGISAERSMPATSNLPDVQQGRATASLVKASKSKNAVAPAGLSPEDVAEIVKSATTPLLDQISQLSTLVDKLGSQPDPAQAPNRGMVLTGSQVTTGGARPAERRSLVDEAAVKARDEKLRYLQSFSQSGDPTMRMMAEEQIHKMLTAD